MALDLDRVTILYVVGILLGIAATVYFGFQLLEDLSPVTTAVLLLLGFVALLLLAVAVETDRLDLVLYALSAGFYLVFVAYLLSTFDVGSAGTFLLLAGSSLLFIGLGFLASRGRLALTGRQVRIGLLIVLLLGIGLVGVDLIGAQPTESTEFDDEIEIPSYRESVTIGTVTVENQFVLPREIESTRFFACTYTPERDVQSLQYRPSIRNELLGGGDSKQYDLVLSGHVFYVEDDRREGVRDMDTIPVEQAETCPESVDSPRVVVVSDLPEPPR